MCGLLPICEHLHTHTHSHSPLVHTHLCLDRNPISLRKIGVRKCEISGGQMEKKQSWLVGVHKMYNKPPVLIKNRGVLPDRATLGPLVKERERVREQELGPRLLSLVVLTKSIPPFGCFVLFLLILLSLALFFPSRLLSLPPSPNSPPLGSLYEPVSVCLKVSDHR